MNKNILRTCVSCVHELLLTYVNMVNQRSYKPFFDIKPRAYSDDKVIMNNFSMIIFLDHGCRCKVQRLCVCVCVCVFMFLFILLYSLFCHFCMPFVSFFLYLFIFSIVPPPLLISLLQRFLGCTFLFIFVTSSQGVGAYHPCRPKTKKKVTKVILVI